MNKFPTRVSKKDVDIYGYRGHQKKPEAPIKIFSKGARHYLHPSLSILDKIDCELAYYTREKIMVISYAPVVESVDNTDYTQKVYKKGALSGDVRFIVDIVTEHIADERKQINRYNTPINSSDHLEPVDITTEDYPA